MPTQLEIKTIRNLTVHCHEVLQNKMLQLPLQSFDNQHCEKLTVKISAPKNLQRELTRLSSPKEIARYKINISTRKSVATSSVIDSTLDSESLFRSPETNYQSKTVGYQQDSTYLRNQSTIKNNHIYS